MVSFADPQRAAQMRQQAAQRAQQAQESKFGWDDVLTKILLPVGLGIATGVTGGMAAPGAAAAIGAGLAGGASGMAAGQQIGSGVENLAEGNTGAGVAQLAGGLASGAGGFVPKTTPLQSSLAAAGQALPAVPNYSGALQGQYDALRASRQRPANAQFFNFGNTL
jgi:hypothetical protein